MHTKSINLDCQNLKKLVFDIHRKVVRNGAIGSIYSKQELKLHPGIFAVDKNNCPLIHNKEMHSISPLFL